MNWIKFSLWDKGNIVIVLHGRGDPLPDVKGAMINTGPFPLCCDEEELA